MTQLNLLLIDDHAMFRAGLAQLVRMALPHATVVQAASVADALAAAPSDIGVVLLDVKLNGSSGFDGIAHIRRRWPLAPVLMLSSQDAPETARFALSLGATAFVSKAETAEKMVSLIAQAANGELARSEPIGRAKESRQLTPRQRDVLALLHQGLPNKLIARKLELSDNTVRRHMQDIFEFFGVENRVEALIAARHRALVD